MTKDFMPFLVVPDIATREHEKLSWYSSGVWSAHIQGPLGTCEYITVLSNRTGDIRQNLGWLYLFPIDILGWAVQIARLRTERLTNNTC